jgi:hypothetical protein
LRDEIQALLSDGKWQLASLASLDDSDGQFGISNNCRVDLLLGRQQFGGDSPSGFVALIEQF